MATVDWIGAHENKLATVWLGKTLSVKVDEPAYLSVRTKRISSLKNKAWLRCRWKQAATVKYQVVSGERRF